MRGNVLQQIPGAGLQNNVQPKPERVSALNVLGEMADWVAGVGGADPMYRPTLDAANDRARQAEADQMAREEFGLKKDKFGLEKQKYGLEIADAQRKGLAKAYIGVKSLYDRYGAEGVRQAAPRLQQLFGLSPEQTQMVADNPEEALMLLQGLAEGGDGIEAGLSLVYGTDENGNTVAYQPLKSGGLRRATPEDGVKLTPGVIQVDQGDRKVILNNRGGQEIAAYGVAGGPEKGEIPVLNERGEVVAYRPAPNSTLDVERQTKINDELGKLESLERAIDTTSDAFNNVETGINLRAQSGAMTTPGMGVGGRAVATIQDYFPVTERVFNEDAATGRQMIEKGALRIVLDLESALTQARGAGVEMGGKQMDTPAELKVRLDTIANSSDYKSAKASFDYIKNQAEAVKRDLKAKIAKKRAELERARSGGAPAKITPPATGGNRFRYDAQGNRIQ